MSKRKFNRFFSQLIKKIFQLQKLLLRAVHLLLRGFLLGDRRRRQQSEGFVLPATALILLVVSIVIAALSLRSVSRTNQVIGERQEQVVYNAASPAVERAKAKIEYLFSTQGNLPAGIPPESTMIANMLNDTTYPLYTLPGEIRLKLNGTTANAWSFVDPATNNTIAYSILVSTQDTPPSTIGVTASAQVKAPKQIIRNAPLGSTSVSAGCINPNGVALQGGWSPDPVNTAVLRKNFQIDAVVVNNTSGGTATVGTPAATLEMLQERQLNQGNRWGAWFRNDLEVFAGPTFNWNGTMHTEGSLFLGNGTLNAFMISSPYSCLFGSDGGINASSITMTQIQDSTGNVTFQGQLVGGKMNNNQLNSPAGNIDETTTTSFTVNSNTDSVLGTLTPSQVALDPLALFTADQSTSRNTSDPYNTASRDTSYWNSLTNTLVNGVTPLKGRVSNRFETKPYVDDTYRADNLYGPKIPLSGLPTGSKVGDTITVSDPNYSNLTTNTFPANAPESVGLDGYWERRAHNEGLRVIVGQRLELGTPLLPFVPTALSANNPHEALQRRNLRDNLAAVQTTAIYHYGSKPNDPNNNLDIPVACVATTVHPGTATTLQRSAIFKDPNIKDSTGALIPIKSDFFNGWGTNGWEYNAPTIASFSNPSMLNALSNLANYSGDPYGAFPAKQDNQLLSPATYPSTYTHTPVTHPYSPLTTAGDFSNLRRAYNNLAISGSYSSLSLADQSTLNTAACTLGILADQVKSLQDFDYTQTGYATGSDLFKLNAALAALTPVPTTPAQAIAALLVAPSSTPSDRLKLSQLARLVYLKEQISWDRLSPTDPQPSCGVSALPITPNNKLSVLCPSGQVYTSLYYLLPRSPTVSVGHAELRTDPYIQNVNSTAPDLYKFFNNNSLNQIRLKPKDTSNWLLNPVAITPPIGPTLLPNYSQQELVEYIDPTGVQTFYRVAFKDAALFSGREMMNVRVLDVDLDRLRQTTAPATSAPLDTWLPAGGIVFAFREDAVREDAIARPANMTWSNYKSVWTSNYDSGPPAGTGTWLMNANPANPQDPPVNDTTGISPKPIDYYADPERRPYGFRLKNGSNIQRVGSTATTITGISFISDQPVYIQADSSNGFNLHQDSSGNLLEEFQASEHLTSNWSNFYSRQQLDPNFARAGDSWLPSAILADAISILSNNFCDGSIEDGILTAGVPTGTAGINRVQYGCTTGGGNNDYTSYLNQNRPSNTLASLTPTATGWQRDNNFDQTSPITISSNGNPVTTPSGADYNGGYYPFNSNQVSSSFQNQPNESWINTVIVSGAVPSRAGQSYGGFHNFPRFLENWSNKNLHIAGSFIQLNFSSYATGPYDHDDWEPSTTGVNLTSAEVIPYYSPPIRLWGYDVGLQYEPPGPVSRRFASISNTRSEFYKELPVNDPYIKILRCATPISSATQFDPNASCP